MARGATIVAIGFGMALAAPAVAPRSVLARLVPGDAFLCAEARSARAPRGAPALPTFHPRVGVTVIDRFTRPLASERYTLDLRKPEAFCRPVRIDGEDIVDPLQGLEVYEARRTRRKPPPPPFPPTTETVESSVGVVRLRIVGIDALEMPTTAAGGVGGTGSARDHFACYQVRAERGTGERRGVRRVEVRTPDGPRTIEVRKPARLCVPASVRGEDPGAPKHPLDLLCYDARQARRDAEATPDPELVATRNAFGNEVLRVGAARLLCVPAARTEVALPTPTPFPTLTPPPTPVPTATPVRTPRPATLRIEPRSTTGLVRDRLCFAASMELPDGSMVDVTATALWRVLDGTVAVPAGVLDGRKCFVGVGIGSTGISARDPVTGVTSPTATLAAEWPIFKLTASPTQIGLRIGDAETLTVIASFSGNRSRNVTQYVRYDSDDPAIARVPNAAGNRSRIEAVSGGRATIAVTDSLSSITETARVVVGALQDVVVNPGPLLFPREVTSLKAIGVFSEGFTSNLTQLVSYESSDPAVVVTTNVPGDRSRVEALSPGTAVITAVDAQSGIRSTCCGTVSVLGRTLDLVVTPTRVERRLGVDLEPLVLTARGFFAVPPNGNAARTVSERVGWSSSRESVVTVGGVDVDNRRQLDVHGGGEALVVATDPGSGLTSLPATVTIYEHLDRIDVGTSAHDQAENTARTIVVGASTQYFAHGYFDGGRHRLLNEAYLVASDPSLVTIAGRYVSGLHPGTVTISAIDDPSGLSSDAGGRNAILQILGAIVRIVLAPKTVTLDPGQMTSLTAIGHHDGGGAETITQRVIYESSDPTIVVATNETGNRSRIVAVGPGTATISAHDPATEVTSSASGDDAIVTVRNDPVERIVIVPSTLRLPAGSTRRLTAVGYVASGENRNFTQRVAWTSSAPAIAAATNPSGDRSRIDALTPGTTVISVDDPISGVRSTDSGDDLTLTVGALTAITITPSALTLAVGSTFSLTTNGTLDDGGAVNLTQDVLYRSSDETVLQTPNEAGNRSRIAALAPGTVTITAFRASAYPQVQDSNAVTVTVTVTPAGPTP